MSAPKFLRGNYSDLFGSSMLPVLEELFRSELKQHPSRRDVLFKTVPTERDVWQSSELHDMPLFNQMSEADDYSYEAPKQGASKTLSVSKYGLGFSISEEAVDDGKFAFIADAVQKMAKSARESQEIQAMNILNNAFGSTTTADGVALCSTAHTLPSGGTFRSKLSSDADLSATSLEQALLDFETQFVGDTGIINLVQPKILMVAPSNKRLAKELIGSELKATTATAGSTGITNVNNMNSFKEEGLIVVSSPHLTDSDAWFLCAAPSEMGLRIISRKPIETKGAGPDAGFDNDSIKYKSRYREVIGAIHAYGIMGSAGA
jgi:phage major head subunit gpT-like protein